MKTIQERKVNMFLTVEDFSDQNAAITATLPGFDGYFADFKKTIVRIMLMAELQKDAITGVAKEKKRLRENLINLASDSSNSISAYAKFTTNELLLDKVKFNISELIKMSGVQLKNYAQIIYNKAEANIGSLAEYGITPDTQKAFLEAINLFDASLAKPRISINEKAKATTELAGLFVAANALLANMDAAVKIIKRKEPGFYMGYTSNRKMINTGSGMLALKATAKEMTTREPVHGAVFTFIHEADFLAGSINGDIVKKTSDKGSFLIRNMKAGTYNVIVRKPGFKEKEVKVTIDSGETSELNVELERA